ncbi:DUF6270 domain-containing protein [Rothia sp. P7208]|uniref:DUF6270 domain-containing protein n=1 Tax=Rothia sp. P7208 TaxID=3402660 RepID=UPI003AD0B78E
MLIYGSCVSRDMFELLSPDSYTIVRYIARQSLISMSRSAISHRPQNFRLKSPFQDMMSHEDWLGTAWWRIDQARRLGIDTILWDLFDERFGVYRFPEEEVVTRSIDMMGTPLEDAVQDAKFIRFGSDEHFSLWSWSAQVFKNRLVGSHLFSSIVVLRVPWASYTDGGQKIPSGMGLDADKANVLYDRYYDFLESLGFSIIDLSDFPVRAEPLHQWGLAPFHYTLDVYQEIVRQLHLHGFLPNTPLEGRYGI